MLLLRWLLLLLRRCIWQPSVAPRLPYTAWSVIALEDWRWLQLWRLRVVWSHWRMGKPRTPLVRWWRGAAYWEMLRRYWVVLCRGWRRGWRGTEYVAEEVAQVPGGRSRNIGRRSEGGRTWGYKSCSARGIYLPYPSSHRRWGGVQYRPAARRVCQLLTPTCIALWTDQVGQLCCRSSHERRQ